MSTKKTAFITGIAGQDGAYLAKFLQDKGYRIHGLIRWDSFADPMDGMQRLDALGLVNDDITLHHGDITDASNMAYLIKTIEPDEIYNLAALSHVKVSFETPASTLDINAKGALNIFDAVRVLDMHDDVRIYQASSSEMFGNAQECPQNETTAMTPCSPYGVAKQAGYNLARIYRDSYNMFVCNGILFNHESPLRGQDFVTAKIARNVVDIERGAASSFALGNLDSVRDWGHAADYVRGMWMMMQAETSDDYVLASEHAYSVRDFTQNAFSQIGIRLEWQGEHGSIEETGIDAKTGKTLVTIDPMLFRPQELHHLLGDASKARDVLGWKPKISFDDLVTDMVNGQRSSHLDFSLLKTA